MPRAFASSVHRGPLAAASEGEIRQRSRGCSGYHRSIHSWCLQRRSPGVPSSSYCYDTAHISTVSVDDLRAPCQVMCAGKTHGEQQPTWPWTAGHAPRFTGEGTRPTTSSALSATRSDRTTMAMAALTADEVMGTPGNRQRYYRCRTHRPTTWFDQLEGQSFQVD